MRFDFLSSSSNANQFTRWGADLVVGWNRWWRRTDPVRQEFRFCSIFSTKIKITYQFLPILFEAQNSLHNDPHSATGIGYGCFRVQNNISFVHQAGAQFCWIGHFPISILDMPCFTVIGRSILFCELGCCRTRGVVSHHVVALWWI